MRDLLIVGSGPAGLTAAIHAASEGLDVEVWEQADRVGGAAGRSCRIDNYPGFPAGITGTELTERMADQARRFGARFRFSWPYTNYVVRPDGLLLAKSSVETPYGPFKVAARGMFLATGKPVRGSLGVLGDDLSHVHYGTTDVELPPAVPVAVIGGGNAAGQAAIGLAERGHPVDLLLRTDFSKMSWYLEEQVVLNPMVTIYIDADITTITSQMVFWRDGSGNRHGKYADAVFVFTGQDEQGADCPTEEGVWTIGDAVPGSVSRIPVATGSAAQAVSELHQYLKHLATREE